MKQETQKLINDRLSEAAGHIDAALTRICEAASIAVLDRELVYAENLIRKAMAADGARAGCLGCIIEHRDPKKNTQ